MAGHSKWSQIKRQKAVEDAKKSRLFAVFAENITTEVKNANGDRQASGVRAAIEKARSANMPLAVIERAIERASRAGSRGQEILYEAYGPGGAALLIIGRSDNQNRTRQEIKNLLQEFSIQLAAPGSVLWAFEKKGGKTYQPRQIKQINAEEQNTFNEIIKTLRQHPDIREVFTDIAQ